VGVDCVPDDPDDPCAGVDCSDHGTCRAVDDLPTCDCDAGYRHAESTEGLCGGGGCDLLCVPAAARDAPLDELGAEDGPVDELGAGDDGDVREVDHDGVHDDDHGGGDVDAATVPCGDGVCEPDEHCASCPADCCVCPAPETLVDETLASEGECSGAVAGGAFAGGGWRTVDFDSRVVYDLGRPIDCGAVWIEVLNFDPTTEYVHVGGEDRYLNFLALYQGDHGNHWTAAEGHETMINLQATDEEPDSFRDRKIKFKVSTGTVDGWGGGDSVYTRADYDWDLDHVYRLCVDWNGERARLFVDGGEQATVPLSWAPEGASSPALRHLFVGRTRMGFGGWLDGATYANLRVIDGGRCP
jgi:hypothetical protein